jgi:hypothetical protein
MIVFLAANGHSFPIHTLANGKLGAPTPAVGMASYDEMFKADTVRQATYVFAGLDQLYDWELQLAADLYRALAAAGLKVLNDPARVMSRYELLRTLHEEGINPFDAYRADSRPRPRRFPVFLRREFDHKGPLSGLIEDQAGLDRFLAAWQADGHPLRGVLVVEFCGEPVAPGVWRKLGTFRIGDAYHVHGAVVEDSWTAKHGTRGLPTEEMYRIEAGEIASNAVPAAVRRAFDLSGIEWGRADHTMVGGRDVIYEINTNPWVYRVRPMPSPIRDAALAIGRERMGRLLFAIDTGDGSPVSFVPGTRLEAYRHNNAAFTAPIRP